MKHYCFALTLTAAAIGSLATTNIHATISNPQVSNDANNLYFSYTESKSFTYYHVFIDSDMNPATGYSIGGIGANLMLENNGLSKSTANGSSWSWSYLAKAPFTNSNNTLNWSLPLSTLGTLTCNQPINIVYNAQNASGSGDTSAIINHKINVGGNCSVITNPQATANNTDFIFSYDVSAAQAHYRVYIDTDQNASTGYSIGGIGANYLLLDSTLYKYENTTWKQVGAVTFTQTSANAVSWTVGRDVMGSIDCAGAFSYVYEIESSSGTVIDEPAAVLTFSADPNCTTPPPPSSAQNIAVPAYFEPCTTSGCNWSTLNSSIPTVGIAVINPNSGPGSALQQSYVTQTKTTQSLGAKVLGYVDTNYGTIASSKVTAQIDDYYNWYNVDGIFFDEGYSNDCTMLSYYETLNSYVKAKGGASITIVNYGTNTPSCYANASDILIEFEDVYSNYSKWKATGWESTYPASKFWHIVYNTPQSSLASAISLSQQRNVGYVYVTSLTTPNPYLNLPASAYWSSEVSLIKAATAK
ncbi:spherulation-specific family 4 protein [Legionella sp.]|uniref:spherulation-specific family 4 protein n=1 Tax=Legionella sp. TaxID=459 RepID=UPI003CA983A1